MRLEDLGQPTLSLTEIQQVFTDKLADYEAERKWESETIMDILLTAVMKKYDLPEIRLSLAEFMEADSRWIERNKGKFQDGVLITFKGEVDKSES